MRATVRSVVVASTLVALATGAAAAEIPVEGRVLGPGGLPFPGARVRLVEVRGPVERFDEAGREPAAAGTAVAGDDGDYRVAAPAAGIYRLRVEADGFAPMELPLEPLVAARVAPDVALEADAGLVVRVVGKDGAPVADTIVAWIPDAGRRLPRFLDPGERWEPAPFLGRTGDDGVARVSRPPGSAGRLKAAAPGRAPRDARAPGGTATTVALPDAPVRRLRVVAADGVPVAGALVTASRADVPLGLTGDDGVFEVPLPPAGFLEVRVETADGRSAPTRIDRSDAPSPDDPARIARTLRLPDVVWVPGRALDEETRRGVSGALVWDASAPGRAVRTDASGGFALPGSPGETLDLVAASPEHVETRGWRHAVHDDGRPGPTLLLRPGATVEGSVVGPDGDAVAGASVSMRVRRTDHGAMRIMLASDSAASVPRARANGAGRFRLGPVDPDLPWEVRAEAPGFAPATETVLGLEPRRTRSGVRLRLGAGLAIAGTVTDPAGAPLADVEVVAARGEGRGRGRLALLAGGGPEDAPDAVYSDKDGRFRVDGLEAGTWDLRLTRTGYARRTVPGLEPTEDAPVADAGTIALDSGERVEGRVVDTEGRGIEAVEVRIARRGEMAFLFGGGGGRLPDAVSGPDGFFALDDLAAGEALSLSFRRPGYVAKNESGIAVPASEPIRVVLEAASNVSGRVLDATGDPIAGADVTLTRSVSAAAGGNRIRAIMRDGAQSDADGRFRFEDVAPADVALSASASGYREATLDPVAVPKGADLDDVVLTLEPGAVLVGRVLAPDGGPAAGATVREANTAGGASPVAMPREGAPTDGDGYYRLEGLAPGARSIEVTGEQYVRIVKDVDLKPGINALDFRFEGGQDVEGTVVDAAGMPVPGAWVTLAPAGRRFGGRQATAGPDGAFHVAGVADGDYRATAGADGFAPMRDGVAVRVEGAPVSGVTLALESGHALVGRVLGIDERRYPEVAVTARGLEGGGFGRTGVDLRGRFRVGGLGPGRFQVVASVGGGRQASAEATIEDEAPETPVDVVFGEGLTLSGRVLLGDRPFAGVAVSARGRDVVADGWTRTDRDGRFRIEGLDAGTYDVDVRQWETGIGYGEAIALDSSREVELRVPTARVGGRVVDAADRAPIAGVRVTVEPPEGPADAFLGGLAAVTDAEGRFEVGNVPDGSFVLTASREGYAAHTDTVTVQGGRDVSGLRVALDATEGLVLRFRTPTGAVPSDVTAAILDPASGRALLGGSYDTGENGAVRFTTVPPGTWEVLAASPGTGTLRLAATAPGAPFDAVLPEACRLSIRVPALEGTADVAVVRIRDATGRPFRSIGWLGDPQSEWRLAGGRIEIDAMPPGSWTVVATATDGRTWTGSASTVSGGSPVATLESAER